MHLARRLGAIALPALIVATPVAAQDAATGGTLFKQRCQMCHSVTPGQRGLLAPNLVGVVDRKAASADFAYSPALKNAHLTWDRPTLDKFLAAPSKLVPGTRMVIAISDPKQRADLIAYLAMTK